VSAYHTSVDILNPKPRQAPPDEYVRNNYKTARAFSVVTSALDISSPLPFLKAVCRSKTSLQARHTTIHIIQKIAIMCGLSDEQQLENVRTMAAAFAKAAAPCGIESFDGVLRQRSRSSSSAQRLRVSHLPISIKRYSRLSQGVPGMMYGARQAKLLEATVELAQKVGILETVGKIVRGFKDKAKRRGFLRLSSLLLNSKVLRI
jgi:hypothetical protein